MFSLVIIESLRAYNAVIKRKMVNDVNKFIDIAAMENEEVLEKIQEEKVEKPIQKKKKTAIPQGEKEFIRFENGEVEHLNDFINGLKFSERFNLLFGEENRKEIKIIIVSMVVVLFLVIGLSTLRGGNRTQIPSNKAEVNIDMEYFSKDEWSNVSIAVESELSIYETEEVRKIRDYLDVRGNRGATLTSLRTQRSKKENTYLYLKQNKGYYRDNLDEYEKMEEMIVSSLAFSQKAINAFDSRDVVSELKQLITN